MSAGLDFIKEDMSFQEMIAAADKNPVSRRSFIAAVGVALAAGVTLKPDEAYAWNSFNSKVSGPAYSLKGLADCVHEDITQIAYAYALHKMYRENGLTKVQKRIDSEWRYDIEVPNIPGGLINPWRPHDAGPNGQAACFSDSDLMRDPLPNALYAENVAFLRMGAFWNDSASDSITDFMWNYLRRDIIEPPDKKTYESVVDVANHILKDQKKESNFFGKGSALVRFSMGERASFLHAMQAFQPDATTPLPQGLTRKMMLEWLGVAWEYARTGDPDNIEVEGLSKKDCRTIFDAFIDIYHQCYKEWGGTELVCENWPLQDLLRKHGTKGPGYESYGSPSSVKASECYGYDGPNPLNIRDMECRSIPLPKRFMRLRALGMFAHTIEDSWCAAHCSRTYPTASDSELTYQIVGFNHYYRQKGSNVKSEDRHKPYDQVCKVDMSGKPWKGTSFDNTNNLRQILTYNPDTPWYKFWDVCDWFPDRYNFSRGTNKLYNFAPGETVEKRSGQVEQRNYVKPAEGGIEYNIFDRWYSTEVNIAKSTDAWNDFKAYSPVGHSDTHIDFKTLGMSESINTMAALFQLFMQDKPWTGENGEKGVRDWLLENTLKCAFRDDDESMYSGTYPIDASTTKALAASSWICTGGRRSLDSGRLLLGNVQSLKDIRLGIRDEKYRYKFGLKSPCQPLQSYVNWEDWAAKYFNEYNDGTAQCKKVDGKGFTEDDGMAFVKEAYDRLSACMSKAVEINGKDAVVKKLGSTMTLTIQQVFRDLAGLYNEFLIQKTGKLPTSENALSTQDVSSNGESSDEETPFIEAIPSDLEDLFDDIDDDDETTTDLLVSIQSIGSAQPMDLSTSITPGDDADEYRPYMFTNQNTLSPFCAWAKVGSAVDDQLLTYGEKGDGITVTLRFFADNVAGDDYECEVTAVDNKRSEDNAYRVFGQVVSVDDESLTLNIHTLNTDGEHVTDIHETFPFLDGFDHEELDGVEEGTYVNLLLRKTPESDTKEIQGFAVIQNPSSDDDDDDVEDFFDELQFTNIINAPIYDVFSNSVSLVTGELDAESGSIAAPHCYAYYQEGATEDTEYTPQYAVEYNEGTGEYEQVLATYNEETGLWDEDENGEPLEYYQEASNTSFTLVSTVSYEQGVLCDIPLQCEPYDGEVENGYTMSALVYQDNSIQDMENKTYVTHYTKGDPSEGAEEPQFEEVEQQNDPLYLSYLAVGMCDDHADKCELPQHYVSNGAGKHTVLCDDYIVHGTEDCTDEDGNLCVESGKPCVKCSYNLSPGEPGTPTDDNSNKGSSSGSGNTNKTATPNTGDSAPLGAFAAVATAAAAGAVLIGSKALGEDGTAE